MQIQSQQLTTSPDGRPIEQFRLTNKSGINVEILTFGAAVRAVEVPDRDGRVQNVVLGHENVEDYFSNAPYFGATCGRFANRIANGRFRLGDDLYSLATNNEPNHLHGGIRGFSHYNWSAETLQTDESIGVRLTHVSPDGDEGYPGELTVHVTYTLNNADELKIAYVANSTKATPINLTNHSYWNLKGAFPNGDNVFDHRLTLHCSKYLPVNETLIPTGALAHVAGSPMDFQSPTSIGARIAEVDGGYDHCFVINDEDGDLRLAASVFEPTSGRLMTVATTEPSVQFYTANFLDGKFDCGHFAKHLGFCLECQHFPDSPNQSQFPSTILQPGQTYSQTTVHSFSVR